MGSRVVLMGLLALVWFALAVVTVVTGSGLLPAIAFAAAGIVMVLLAARARSDSR